MVEKIQPPPVTLPVSPVGNVKSAGSTSTNPLFHGLNIDQFGLSEDARSKVSWAKAQFELNYQVLKSVNSSQGFETTQEIFSFKGSYEFLQRASGREDFKNDQEAETEEVSEQDALSQLQDYFSPENTAQRILDVATSFFPVSETGQTEGNNEAARRKFADFIGGAINEGFRQAREILGKLSDDIETGIDKTHSLVFSGLEDFVKNGIDPEKTQSGGVFEKIAAYRAEAALNMRRIVSSSTSGSYNANGELSTPAEPAKIFQKG